MSTEKKLTGYPSIDKPWLKYYDEEFLKLPLPEMTIYEYLKSRTAEISNYTAFTYYGRKISYAELHRNIEAAAKVLVNLGVKSGNRIMYLMPNIPETAYFLYAGARIGAVSDYIDPRPDSIDPVVSAKKVLSLFKEERIDYIVSLDLCYLGMLKPIEKELRELGLEEIIIVNASDSMNKKATFNYLVEKWKFDGFSALKASVAKTKKMATAMTVAKQNSCLKLTDYKMALENCKDIVISDKPYEPDSLAVIVHTSGTSNSKPKPIPLTHDNMNAYVHQTFGGNMPMKKSDKALHVLPYFAAFGIVDVVHAGLCHGNNLIEIPEFVPYHLGEILCKHKPQIVIGTPSWFLSLKESKSLSNKDLSYLTMVTYGGDSMEPSDEEKINEFLRAHNCKCLLTKGHGMSETCGCASYAIGEYNLIGSVGIPMPNTVYALVDPETKDMLKFSEDSDYIEGELVISSKVVTSGVLDGKEIVPHAEYNGDSYIFTRDIARMDKNGVMTFLSRSDRSFTRYDGFKVKPYEIEAIIKEYPSVDYCVITPFEDSEKHGNMPMATIVLNGSSVPARAEQIEIAKGIVNDCFVSNPDVSSRQIPSRFRFRDKLPLSANGKVSFNEIIKEGLNGEEIIVELEETTISVGSITVK